MSEHPLALIVTVAVALGVIVGLAAQAWLVGAIVCVVAFAALWFAAHSFGRLRSGSRTDDPSMSAH